MFRFSVQTGSLVIFLFLLSVSFHSNANEKEGINPRKPIKNLVIDQWSGEDGMISNNLTSVMQASTGFIWVTSFNGVMRFDGIQFELYDKEILPFLRSNGIYKSIEDKDGKLWFCTQGSGVITYDAGKFAVMPGNDSISPSIRCILTDSKNRIWAGSNNGGLFVNNGHGFENVDQPLLHKTNIMDLEELPDGSICIATNGNGIVVFHDSIYTHYGLEQGLSSDIVNILYLDKQQRLYIGTAYGLDYFEKGRIHKASYFRGVEINDIVVDDYGTIWAGTEQGLGKINDSLGIYDFFSEKDGLPASQISSICFDHENSLWASTKKAGLIRFKDGNFTNFTKDDGLSSDNVNIIAEHQGKFYVGSDDGQVNIIDNGNFSRIPFKTNLRNTGIRDICFVNDHTLLVSSYRGVLKLQDGNEKMLDIKDGLPSNDVRRIFLDSRGEIWLGTRSGGLAKMKGDHEYEIYNAPDRLLSNYILAVEEDQAGNILVGTHSGGLSVITPEDQIETFSFEPTNSGMLIFNILPESPEVYWLATNVGIFRFFHGKFEKVAFDKRFKTETFFDILKDDQNSFWLTSNIGLFQVAKSEMDDFFRGDIDLVKVKLYDNNDGMASKECTGATRSTISSDGKLWVPTLGGVAVLDPDNIRVNRQLPQIYITGLSADYKDIPIDALPIVMEPGFMRFNFRFTGLSLFAPNKMQFRYKLQGVDKDWVIPEGREARYTNLPAGRFTFEVIASNNDGIWNEQPASIHFMIKPYFYQTIWFYLLIAVLVGLSVWGFVIWRTHNVEKMNVELRKLNAELDRFVYSTSHDLRAPLTSVMGLVDIAIREKTSNAKDECLQLIDSSVKKLDSFIKDIMDYSRNQRIEIKKETINFEQLINEALTEIRFLDKNDRIEKAISIENHTPFISDKRRLSVILNNLLSNAVRYHNLKKEHPFIKVNVSLNELKQAEISVMDNGKGIKKEHLERIFEMFYRAEEGSQGSGLGLFIVKETVDKLHGKIDVESEFDKGTIFRVTLPSLN